MISPIPRLDLEIIDLIWLLKGNSESSIRPGCLCSSVFEIGVLLNRIGGWLGGFFFLENISSTACLVGSGLNDIFHLFAYLNLNHDSNPSRRTQGHEQ